MYIDNHIKWKRIGLIIIVLIIFFLCFDNINKNYDPLSRYEYSTDENREIMLKYLTQKDINFVISQKLKPEDFMPYIELENFDVRNTVWYNKAKSYQDASNDYIINFVNQYKDIIKKENFEGIISNYTYSSIEEFYTNGDPYHSKSKLVLHPDALNTLIDNNTTLYKYVPKDLITISHEEIPMVNYVDNFQAIQVRNEVKEPLLKMCDSLKSMNGITCGNLILVQGFVSYEQQVDLYSKALMDYGNDTYSFYTDQPGHSEYQLGYTVRFELAKNDYDAQLSAYQQKITSGEITEGTPFYTAQEMWLMENAYKYGFIIRYPYNKQDNTGKYHQRFTLRYVGIDIAEKIHEQGITLDEMVFENE